uniref:ATP synthase subunit a n=1 Tax=Goniodes dissimilis TaxID=186210 RepID=A0A9E9EUE5_9NEOP|nr:ATP synthase F0 subunit 6 [Goniodes dissimilis]
MVCGLFSSFDPSVSVSLIPSVVKWLVGVEIGLIVGWRLFTPTMSWELILMKLGDLTLATLCEGFGKRRTMEAGSLLLTLILCVMLSNVLGLIPGQFTTSAHLSVNLSVSLTMWAGGVVLSLINNFESSISHFLPSGSPELLWPLLVLVETVSWMIRPFTLAIRLMANVMAGHLILTLMSESFSLMSVKFSFLISVESVIIMFEVGVGVIQAYVFSNLIGLYWKESSNSNS